MNEIVNKQNDPKLIKLLGLASQQGLR